PVRRRWRLIMPEANPASPVTRAPHGPQPPRATATERRASDAGLVMPAIVVAAPLVPQPSQLGWSLAVSLLAHGSPAVGATAGFGLVLPQQYAVRPARNSPDMMASMSNPAPVSDAELIVVNAPDAVKENTEFEATAPEADLPKALVWSPRKPDTAPSPTPP